MTTRAGAVSLAQAARALCSGLLAACLLLPQAASSIEIRKAIFERERASADVRHVANWVVHAGDNQTGNNIKLPFAILDKKDARVYVFNAAGRLQGAAPALLGIGVGDTALPGIGARELSAIAPKDRITQAGRFISEIGADSHGEDVLWLDYEGGLAMHRVITTNPQERRAHRLATSTPADNRISYGCINLPVKFYEEIVRTTFSGMKGIVYVLPETKPVHTVFASYDVEEESARAPLQAGDAQSPMRRVSATVEQNSSR